MYFISQLGRAKLDHEVVERIEQNIREALDAATEEINKAIDQAEALLEHHNIETLASYDTVPLQEQIGITSSFGRRYFDLMHKLDIVMPMMETLAIEEIINERELETRRSLYKRVVLSISTKARNFWMGVRRRMNEKDARLAAEAAKAKPQASRPVPSPNTATDEPVARETTAADRVDEGAPVVSGGPAAAPASASETSSHETESAAASA
ncbi:MAG: hypothetical protein MUF54_26000 [Polyangiaceae bacterium]|nr:hypothetical protein [Polyangiaceae bacterium]